MSVQLGDYAENGTINFKWSTNNASGAAITRATDGVISVYKGNSITQTVIGITDTEDFDGITGIHHCEIDLSDAFYAAGNDYQIILTGATIDGESVVAVLANFSIENRADIAKLASQISVDNVKTVVDLLQEILANRVDHVGTTATIYKADDTPLGTFQVKNKNGDVLDSTDFGLKVPTQRTRLIII